jgi:hypothetical protein
MPASAANATQAARLALWLERIICLDAPMPPNFPLPSASEVSARIAHWSSPMPAEEVVLALRQAWDVLNELHVPAALVGGLALAHCCCI